MSSKVYVYSMMMQPLLRLGMVQSLASEPECVFSGNVESLDELHTLTGYQPSSSRCVLALDYAPNAEGMKKWIASLHSEFPNLSTLVFLPVAADRDAIVRAMRWSADAYLLQTATPEVLIRAILELGRGRSYLESQVVPVVIDEIRRPNRQIVDEVGSQVSLSDRDRMLLQLAADGLSNAQIAVTLGLAEKTVRNAWSQLFERLGMPDRTQAVLWAIRTGHAELR